MVNDKKNTSGNKRRDVSLLLVLFGIIILVNFIGSFYFKRFDLTSEKRYTLAESTKKLLSELNEEVLFKVYLNGNFNPDFTRLKNETKEILDEFRAYSDNQVQYEFITPGEGLAPAEKENIERQLSEKGLIPEQIVQKQADKTLETVIWPGAIASFKGKEAVWQIFKRQLGVSAEECINNSVEELEYSLTTTIRKLQRDKKLEVTFIEGHQELDTLHQYDFMRALSEYYNVNRTPILGKLAALKGSDAIIINRPDTTINDRDRFIIDQYIMSGGKVLWLIDPVYINRDTFNIKGYTLGLTRNTGVEEMLFKYGVRLNPLLIQDFQCAQVPINVGFKGSPNFKFFPWVYSPLVMPDLDHPIVKNLDLIKFDFASTLDTVTAKGIKKTILLRSSKTSKAQPTPARIFVGSALYPQKESQFHNPYLSIACLLEGEFSSFVEYRLPSALLRDTTFKYIDKGKRTKMIIVADGDVGKNDFDRSSGRFYPLGYDKYSRQAYANKTFLLNCVNYLLDDEGLLQLRSREVKLRQLDKKKIALQRTKWQMTNVVLPLALVIVLGIISFYLRKRKYTS
ncbi:MAG: gliding motility-associated ABC transporter substrate-binding protein GldG [Bacteroidetes bacterium]|nr:gliding motility-associated ABC transporter substrate-binding protein GldG [Bacteroidota bacterium]